jgi:hypothetical protein
MVFRYNNLAGSGVPNADIGFAAGGSMANVAVHALVRSRTDFADYDP